MDLLHGLNEPQREAVLHENGPLLIFAGAGSGKTRTLTHRIAHLVNECGVFPSRILAVTFTNKAAREMRERLDHLIGTDANRLWLGTFHAMCAQMLRINGGLIGIDPRFNIFDSDDSQRTMKDALRDLDIDSDRFPPARVLGRISDAKNNLLRPDDFATQASTIYDKTVARLYTRYQERLKEAHALDFDDLIGEAVRLLKESDDARSYWSERFLHVLIDEFQDANAAQFQWAQLLASRHRNICVVGDDDQSIYAWRGANVRLILEFELSYPDARIVRLEQNYRSTQNILDAAHGVISKNAGRAPKRLWTEEGGGAQLYLHGAINAQEEALWVVRKIQELMRQGRSATEFAILCRVNAQSRPFEEAFIRARVPLRLVGTQRFYERREIKDLIAYLKVLHNPNDSLALARIINVPGRGIGATTVDRLQGFAAENRISLHDAIRDPGLIERLGRAPSQKVESLRRLLDELEEDAKRETSVAELLSVIVERLDYNEFLRRDKTLDSVDRVANVQEFLSAAALFDDRMKQEPEPLDDEDVSPRGEPPHLGAFLETVALDNPDTARSDEAATLMTLHSAKGLEFPFVFLAGAEQGLLPHARALWGEGNNEDELEEERRLCYVGLTRAREQVFLTYAAQRTLHGRTESTQPSQFLDEIPAALLQRSGLAASTSPSLHDYATEWGGGGVGLGARHNGSAKRAVEPPTFQIGDKLKHPTFGEGMVVAASGVGGAGEWVEVAFLASGAGKKKLVVAYAPLEKAE